MDNVVTRFPPSPTGHLHIGGARTALFNWLLARSINGNFILRLEDTDLERSSKEMTDSILEAMEWLGLNWDEGPYFQSQRTDIYQRHIDYLLESKKAYYCQCSPAEVEAMREQAKQRGQKPKYNGKCRDLNLGPAPGRVVRFKSPLEGETSFTDLLKGENIVDNHELDDFILRRADGSPTYNLAVVVDDALMGVTHILRGDDHLSNTPKQVLLYRALGYRPPEFGHVPMILGPDKKKLSKRHGALSVLEYKRRGYLPEALINYLARLGWSYGDQEIFQVQELIEKFSCDNLGRSACVFDPDKLDWVNSQHIKSADKKRLSSLLQEYLGQINLPQPDTGYLEKVVPLLQPRSSTLLEMARQADIFVCQDEDISYDPELVQTFLTLEVKEHLSNLREKMKDLPEFSQKELEKVFSDYLSEKGIKFKLLAQPVRISLTGRKTSPGLFETMEVLGKDRVINRLGQALQI